MISLISDVCCPVRDLEKSGNILKEFRDKNRQVIGSLQLLLEQERLIREVQTCPDQIGVNSTLYIELKKQHELAKSEEIKNVPIINVLDEARPAAKKELPRRSTIVLTTLFLSLFGIVVFVLINERYGPVVQQMLSNVHK